ncbi:MAG TPA: hypothetical protein VK864_08950 [Longimicrobiales bacterium]|nr:hypothetical protein [Longimicrobiales bacterium]
MRSSPAASLALVMIALATAACSESNDPQDVADARVPSISAIAGYVSDDQLQAMVAAGALSAEAYQDLATVRQVTAPFHRIDVAEASGWPRDVTGCLDFPDGYMDFGPGAMGHHWLNVPAYLDGGVLDVSTPEALLYETQADGSLRLTAVEYIIPERFRPRTDPPPVMFGRQMMFHPQFAAWGLHVWLWLDNPYGLFADVNPRVGCQYAVQQ